MSQSALRAVLAGLGVFACVGMPVARQEPERAVAAAPTTQRASNLAGNWEFDDDQSKEDQRNWRRPVASQPIPGNSGGGFPGGGGPVGGNGGTGGGPPSGGAGGYLPRPTGGASFESDLRRALRDLLEAAERYQIMLKPDQVTITDDLGRALTFSTSGKKEKHRIGATNFEAKTTWDGALLKQEIDAIGGFHMSQVFFPAEDGRAMFVSIRVDKPQFTPPIKPITRTYRRTN